MPGRSQHRPAATQHLEQLGAVPVGSTPEEFGKLIKTEAAKWAPTIKAAGIKAQ